MAWTVFYKKSSESRYRALYQCYFNTQMIEILGLLLSATFNLCLIYDLITMLQSPFADKKQSLRKYLAFCIPFSMILALASTHELLDSKSQYKFFGTFFALFYIFVYLIGLYSCYLAYKILSKPGISGSLRSLILKRHTAGIILFQVCNLYVLVFAITEMF